MYPHERGLLSRDFAAGQRQVQIAGGIVAVGMEAKTTPGGVDVAFAHALNGALIDHAKVNEVGNGAYFQPVAARELDQCRAICQQPFRGKDVRDHRRRQQARQRGIVTCRLGMAGPRQHTARQRREGKDMPRLDDIGRYRLGCHGRLHGAGAICRRNAGINTLRSLNRQGEVGLLAVGGGHHRWQVELAATLLGQRQAHQTARLARHEIDMRRADMIGRHHDHAFIVTVVIVVHQHHHAALADVTDQFVYAVCLHAFAILVGQCAPNRAGSRYRRGWPGRCPPDVPEQRPHPPTPAAPGSARSRPPPDSRGCPDGTQRTRFPHGSGE